MTNKEKLIDTNEIRLQTVEDFSNQWKIHGNIKKGFWTDKKWLENMCQDIFDLKKIKDKNICEIGSGVGRVVKMLHKFNPKFIHCVEPSSNIKRLTENLSDLSKIKIHNIMGHELNEKNLDYVFSIGVIHHIKNPSDVLSKIFSSLKQDGEFIMWVYGQEGNQLYLFFYNILSFFTKRMNDTYLNYLSALLSLLLIPYIKISKMSPKFPMHYYLKNVFEPCDFQSRKYIIFDQLNPHYAKYYKKQECIDLLNKHGFKKIKIKRYQNYSWIIKGSKIG